jgi:myo-inositol-1(or 4)-monophosphatase
MTSTASPSPELRTAIRAAREAARVALERLDKPQSVTVKGFRDIMTEADVAAQDAAVSRIRAQYPDIPILAEENLTPQHIADAVWVIDPLDGTTNYARRFPVFCSSVGLVYKGRPIVGAIYDPLHDHLFVAERGQGARLNGSPIYASDTDALADAILALDWGHAPAIREKSINMLLRIAEECRSVRAIGSAALAMCYLAAGWIDLFYNLSLKPWDGAAAQVIMEEAGARVTTLRGETWDYTQADALASNGELHFIFDELTGVDKDDEEIGD